MPSILWERIDGTGLDRCSIETVADGHRLAGTALLSLDEAPHEIRYTIITDRYWRTRTVGAHVQSPEGDRRLALSGDGEGSWSVSDDPIIELYGAIDVDLAWTPASNTLPILRLGLAVGASAEIVAAHVAYPSREHTRAKQRYERIAEDRYLYSTGPVGSERSVEAELIVNEHGLVVDYPDGWKTVVQSG